MLWTKALCSVQSRWGCEMSVEDRARRERNIEIERQIKADRAALRNRVKILLLGQLEYLARFLESTELIRQRHWRMWQVDDSEADAVNLPWRLFRPRSRTIQASHLCQRCSIDAGYTGRNGDARLTFGW
jgi:hypothetical protein